MSLSYSFELRGFHADTARLPGWCLTSTALRAWGVHERGCVEVEENKGCFDRRFRSSGEEAAYMQIFHGERLNCRKNAIGTVIQIIGMIMPLEACSAWLDVLMWISQVRSD